MAGLRRRMAGRLKIVHVSRYDSGDGAANVAYRLHGALRRLGHDSVMFIAQHKADIEDPTVKVFRPASNLAGRVRRRVSRWRIRRSLARYRSGPHSREAFSDDRNPFGEEAVAQLPSADVVNVHAMYGFVDYRAFMGTVPRRTPVVRTLHDMNFFTGGCHQSEGCTRFTDRCGACPQLGSRDDRDLSREIWERKQNALRHVPAGALHLVAPSQWLAEEVGRSSLLRGVPVTVIPHGVDTDVFRPRDRRAARDVLEIPAGARVVLFVAQRLDRQIKGFPYLARALDTLDDPGLLLVTAGGGRVPAPATCPHLHLGPVSNERFLSLVYSAADVVVMPSLQENFPLTALEALSCGIPVVAFASGGLVEIVRPGVTGFLVPRGDVAGLAKAVSEVLRDRAGREAMAEQCRKVVMAEYDWRHQVTRYLALYQEMAHVQSVGEREGAPDARVAR